MNSESSVSPSARTTGWCGIAAIVMFFAGFGMMVANGLNADPTAPAAALAETVKNEMPAAARAGLFLDVAGSVLFMVFAVGLWARLRHAEGGSGGVSMLVLVAGVSANAAAAGDKAGFYAITMLAGRGLEVSDAQVIYALIGGAFLLFRVFTGLLAGAAAAAAFRTGALPRWSAWLGIAVAATAALATAAPELALSQMTFPLFPIWIVAVGVALVRSHRRMIGAAQTAPAL